MTTVNLLWFVLAHGIFFSLGTIGIMILIEYKKERDARIRITEDPIILKDRIRFLREEVDQRNGALRGKNQILDHRIGELREANEKIRCLNQQIYDSNHLPFHEPKVSDVKPQIEEVNKDDDEVIW